MESSPRRPHNSHEAERWMNEALDQRERDARAAVARNAAEVRGVSPS